jgi:hypothetical protein
VLCPFGPVLPTMCKLLRGAEPLPFQAQSHCRSRRRATANT